MRRDRRAAEHQQTMIVEFFVAARRAEALQIFRRRAGMEVHREQLALDQVGLGRHPQPDRDVRFAHREIEFLLGGQQRDADVGIKFEEFAEPRCQPVHAKADGRLHLQLAMRLLARVGQLGARRLKLHEHFVRGAVEQLALFGQDQPARMTMEQRRAQLLFERAHLARHRRLRQPELLTRMGEAAGLRGGVKHFQLVPVHTLTAPRLSLMWRVLHSAASRRSSCTARKRSASSAAMHPIPAAVTAWR